MCCVGQVHVSCAHARPCRLTRSPHSMPCEGCRSDLDDFVGNRPTANRARRHVFYVLGANEPLFLRSNRGGDRLSWCGGLTKARNELGTS